VATSQNKQTVSKRSAPAQASPSKAQPSASGKSRKPGGRPPGIGGARLRTLPLAIAPVALGTAAAFVLGDGEWHPVRALLCLAVALGLQVAVNYSNDYSDGIRGTDKHRVGPSRLVGSGAASPRAVLTVAFVFYALSALAGVMVVVASGQYWLLVVGAVCIVAAWLYTGGKKPYGYYGFGEVVVFVFFGIVATAGTTYVLAGSVNLESWLAGTAAGLFACAVLVVNNLRDLSQDKAAGKRTLSVLIGDLGSRALFAILMLLPFVILVFFSLLYPNAPYAYLTMFIAIPVVLIVSTAKKTVEFVLALQLASVTALLFALTLAWAIAF
jgi:1,4-dihydroxy-2-naphthoate octaprenyltransferase